MELERISSWSAAPGTVHVTRPAGVTQINSSCRRRQKGMSGANGPLNSSESQEDGQSTKSGSRLLFTRGYSVFNAAQVDDYTPTTDADTPMPERIARAEAFFAAIGADLRHGGNQAFYAPASDHIQMPPFQVFAENMSYYSTLAHEHGHWTANAARCDRQLGKRFGNSAYAAEELIAELGAAFTCAHLGGLARHSGWEFVPGEQRGETRFIGLIRRSGGPPYICLRPRTTA
jgi:antirestriction protein ArdC